MAYRIYTRRNLADTMRDPDEIVHKDTELKGRKDGTYSATDFCSYNYSRTNYYFLIIEIYDYTVI